MVGYPSFSLRAGWWVVWAVLVAAAAVSGARMADPTPYDLVAFSRGGWLLLSGNWSGIYGSDWLQAGPFELIASALVLPDPPTLDRSLLQATESSMGLQRMMLAAVLTAGVPFLVRWLRRSCELSAAPVAELAAAAVCLVLQLPVQILAISHLSQPMVCLMWVWAAASVRGGRTMRAGLVVGLSAGWEPWGILAGALLLVERRPSRVLLAGLTAVAAASACYLPFVLAGPFRLLQHGWPIGQFTFAHLIWPTASRFDWSMRLFQALVCLAVSALAAYLLRGRPDGVWAGPAAVVLGRLLLDPLVLPYYWQPVGLLVVLGCGLMTRRSWPIRATTLAVLGAFSSFPSWAASYEVVLPSFAAAVAVGLPVAVLFVGIAVIRGDSARSRHDVGGCPELSGAC